MIGNALRLYYIFLVYIVIRWITKSIRYKHTRRRRGGNHIIPLLLRSFLTLKIHPCLLINHHLSISSADCPNSTKYIIIWIINWPPINLSYLWLLSIFLSHRPNLLLLLLPSCLLKYIFQLIMSLSLLYQFLFSNHTDHHSRPNERWS